jgi:hypothetical protein
MVKVVNPAIIESDEGFRVERRGKDRIIYSRNDRSLIVYGEMGLRGEGYGFSIYLWSVKTWEPPFEKELIDANTLQAIIDNTTRAMAFNGQYCEISDAPSPEEVRRRFGGSLPKETVIALDVLWPRQTRRK